MRRPPEAMDLPNCLPSLGPVVASVRKGSADISDGSPSNPSGTCQFYTSVLHVSFKSFWAEPRMVGISGRCVGR